jgi:Fur family ferric uptake transcriptional regulator
MKHLEEAEQLRRQGHRLTPQRLLVLAALKSRGQHVTAEEIHSEVVQQHPYIDIATVYRTLQWLQSVGLAAPINTGVGPQRYEYRQRGSGQHHHLVCQQCHVEIELPDALFEGLRAEVQARYGFTLQVDHLALPGTCAGCGPHDAEAAR